MSSTIVPVLVDTNILVYRFDARHPRKQTIATELLRGGILDGSARLPHQALIEFVSATTRMVKGKALLEPSDARREVEDMLSQFTVLYPNEQVVRLAARGAAAYGLSWFDANIWAYAEHFGLSEIVSEDFQDGRLYGAVRARNPFTVVA